MNFHAFSFSGRRMSPAVTDRPGRPRIAKNLPKSDSVWSKAMAASARRFIFIFLCCNLSQNSDFLLFPYGETCDFSYSLTGRWTSLKIYMWPLLDVPNPSLRAHPAYFNQKPSPFMVTVGAHVPGACASWMRAARFIRIWQGRAETSRNSFRMMCAIDFWRSLVDLWQPDSYDVHFRWLR